MRDFCFLTLCTALISRKYTQLETLSRYPSICLSRSGHQSVSFPCPNIDREAFLPPLRRLRGAKPLAHDLNATFFTTATPPHYNQTNHLGALLTLPEQRFWLLTPTRPAFGHLKGSIRTTAPTASDRVISQIASIRKNKDTLNSKPPPSLGSASGS